MTSPPPWLRVAQIMRPQGNRGEVIAELLTDYPERFSERPNVFLLTGGAPVPATIEHSRIHGARIALKFAGCDSIEAAEHLRGQEIVVPWDDRMPLGEDEIYIAELIGARLMDARSGKVAGTIAGVDRESTHTALLVIERQGDAAELLIPFVKAYAPEWNAATHTLTMQLPEGLLDLQAPGTHD